ncbi:MAG: lytic murein transglycosylase [Pseudomonadota bacterium]
MDRFRKLLITVWVAALLSPLTAMPAFADANFQKWIRDFYSVAAREGISRGTYDRAFSGVTSPDQTVLKKARYQPEFRSSLKKYFSTRVNDFAIQKGRKMEAKWRTTLERIERQFGVDRWTLMAIWSMESSFGYILDKKYANHNIVRALATLAYADKKRRKFGRGQLLAALKMLERGYIQPSQLRGSWAGGIGHTQFIPGSYLLYAVDMDGDGRRDIVNSVPDALATAANLLKKNGWQTGKTWGYEVMVPSGFNYGLLNDPKFSLAEWSRRGLKRPLGNSFPRPSEQAHLKMIGGVKGPAHLMIRNFYVLKRYNNSNKYALAVGHLADRMRGFGEFAKPIPNDNGTPGLSIADSKALQKILQAKGFYNGEIDGNIGSGSKAAILQYQISVGLKADGVPSASLLKKMRGG